MCEWISSKSFIDTYKYGTSWTLQFPAPHHIHFKPLAGRHQIFGLGSLLAPGAVAKDWGAVQFLCLGREKTKTLSYWDCRLSTLHSGPRVDNCWTLPPWTENKILKSQLFTFCVWLSLSLSSFSREFSPPPPLCLPSSLKSCEETQAKSGKMCSHLTHFTLITNNTIPSKSPGCCANKANPQSIIIIIII